MRRLIGTRAWVGIDARTGLTLAMSDSADGMGNDGRPVPTLMAAAGRGGRGSGVLTTMRAMMARPGNAFVTRVKPTHGFTATSRVETAAAKGRTVMGELGRGSVGEAGPGPARGPGPRSTWPTRPTRPCAPRRTCWT